MSTIAKSRPKTPHGEAQKLLKEFGEKVPVDLDKILEAKNITVREDELEESVSGMLVIKNDRAVISVNRNHHPNRQRFTKAHELGHFILHGDQCQLFINNHPAVFLRNDLAAEGISPNEIAANNFAAELLMPAKYIKDHLAKQPIDGFDDIAVRKLASHLQVSVQALTIRLTRLNLV